MKTHFPTSNEFISSFNLKKPTFDEFSSALKVIKYTSNDGSDCDTLDDYFLRNPSDGRSGKKALRFKRNLYKMIVEEPEKVLSIWFDRYGEIGRDLEYYFNFPYNRILDDGVFSGQINAKYGKLCRAANFYAAHNTVRTNVGNHAYRTVFADLKLMFEEFIINYRVPTPAFFDVVCRIDEVGYKNFWQLLMPYFNKPSILNPYTYKEILNELFCGDTLFAPCMSWNSCQLAFYNSKFSHFISTDVIPSVVENGRTLHLDWQDWNNSRSVLFNEDKTTDLYLCPSEQLQKRHKFIDKYHGQVDAVLFCPPYFDLELYDSLDQSVNSFPDYQDWLSGYWEETVKTCVEAMRPGARFGFIISNYSHDCGKRLIPISDDMANIVAKHLTQVGKYGVLWNRPVQKKRATKMKDGNFEDLWLFEKKESYA